MKTGMQKTFFLLAGCVLAVGMLVWLVFAATPADEPSWKGRSLSKWLDAYDCNLRFDPGDGRRSGFSDAEIEQALNGIGLAALPMMYDWLTMKPSRWKEWGNRQLNRAHWIQFRLKDDAPDWQGRAETGFMYYGTNAQPLLPKLLQLSHSRDPELRMVAYEAAFFTRPDREIFLPLATQALKEKDAGDQGMAAQWMVQRFPDDAEKAGLRSRFLIFYENQATNKTGLSSQP